MIYLTAQINCESQLQANELLHQIKRFLPPGKYVQLMKFCSFLEIPEFFWSPELNNPDIHDIQNLYCRYDDTTGEVTHQFLAHYHPIVRLNSATAEISDAASRSFQILCDFNYLIQLPMWLFDGKDAEKVARINIGFVVSDNPTSILLDTDFLSVDNMPRSIEGNYYRVEDCFVVDYVSRNYKGNKLVIPKKKNLTDFVIEISKIKIGKSPMVTRMYSGDYRKKSKELNLKKIDLDKLPYLNPDDFDPNEEQRLADIIDVPITGDSRDTTILEENYYTIEEKEKIDEVIIFLSENTPELTPKLNEPLLVKILVPYGDDDIKMNYNQKKVFSKENIYIPRENRKLVYGL